MMTCDCDLRTHHIHCKRGYYVLYRYNGLPPKTVKVLKVVDPKNIPDDIETVKKLKSFRVGGTHEL